MKGFEGAPTAMGAHRGSVITSPYVYRGTGEDAYDAIQSDVECNFHLALGKTPEEIKTICVVGAHHGYEIIRMLQVYPNCVFYAFEPHPDHFSRLISWDIGGLVKYGGMKQGDYDNRFVCINKAVSDKTGEVDFFELDLEGSGSILEYNDGVNGYSIKEKITVEATTLQEELGDMDIDLLWADVQGAELQVLKGANLSKCKSLFLEIRIKKFDYLRRLKETLQQPNWGIYNLEPKIEGKYKGECSVEDLEEHLKGRFDLGWMGINFLSGEGNSLWLNSAL